MEKKEGTDPLQRIAAALEFTVTLLELDLLPAIRDINTRLGEIGDAAMKSADTSHEISWHLEEIVSRLADDEEDRGTILSAINNISKSISDK